MGSDSGGGWGNAGLDTGFNPSGNAIDNATRGAQARGNRGSEGAGSGIDGGDTTNNITSPTSIMNNLAQTFGFRSSVLERGTGPLAPGASPEDASRTISANRAYQDFFTGRYEALRSGGVNNDDLSEASRLTQRDVTRDSLLGLTGKDIDLDLAEQSRRDMYSDLGVQFGSRMEDARNMVRHDARVGSLANLAAIQAKEESYRSAKTYQDALDARADTTTRSKALAEYMEASQGLDAREGVKAINERYLGEDPSLWDRVLGEDDTYFMDALEDQQAQDAVAALMSPADTDTIVDLAEGYTIGDFFGTVGSLVGGLVDPIGLALNAPSIGLDIYTETQGNILDQLGLAQVLGAMETSRDIGNTLGGFNTAATLGGKAMPGVGMLGQLFGSGLPGYVASNSLPSIFDNLGMTGRKNPTQLQPRERRPGEPLEAGPVYAAAGSGTGGGGSEPQGVMNTNPTVSSQPARPSGVVAALTSVPIDSKFSFDSDIEQPEFFDSKFYTRELIGG